MEVMVDIPEDLVKYIEYIPSSALPELIVNILRENILSRHKTDDVRVTYGNDDIAKVLSMLSALQSNGVQIPQVVAKTAQPATPEIEREEEVVTRVVQSQVVDSILEDDELGDLMDLLK